MNFIYALLDPVTAKAMYIGKTNNLRMRLRNHLTDKSSCRCARWVRSVVANGKKPMLVPLEMIPDGLPWENTERSWIATAIASGCDLVNATSGGIGMPNLTPDAIAKRDAGRKGRKRSRESVQRMIATKREPARAAATSALLSEKLKGRKIVWADKIGDANTKLTHEDVEYISMRLSGGVDAKTLGSEHGVHPDTIRKIGKGTYCLQLRSRV